MFIKTGDGMNKREANELIQTADVNRDNKIDYKEVKINHLVQKTHSKYIRIVKLIIVCEAYFGYYSRRKTRG